MTEELHELLEEWSDCLDEECSTTIKEIDRRLKERDIIINAPLCEECRQPIVEQINELIE